MNNPNPLIPQGSLLEQQKTKSKSNLFIAVFTILAIHIVLFSGLLMQGCKREKSEAGRDQSNLANLDTNLFTPQTNLPSATTSTNTHYIEPPPRTPVDTLSATSGVTPQNTVTPIVTPEPPAGGKEYSIAKGDTFAKIAKASGITVKALQEANPNVEPRKLRIKQTIHIPAPVASLANNGSAPQSETATNVSGERFTIYTIKPGDTLFKIARDHGVNEKAIRAANGLRTTQLLVGKKLKIPKAKTTPGGASNTNQTAGNNRSTARI